jgi:transcriptional regulator with GAF, ATPase, and Fis domain
MTRRGRAALTARAGAQAPERSSGSIIEELPRRIAGCSDVAQLLAELARGLGPELPVTDRVSIVFLEPDGEWMRIYRVLPPLDRTREELPRVRVEGTPVGQVVREGVGRLVADVRTDPNITFGHASHDGIRSTVSVPVRIGERVVGAINAGSRIAGGCTEGMLRHLEEVAATIGPAIYAAEQVLSLAGVRERALRAREAADQAPAGDMPAGLVGRSAAFRRLIDLARRAARSDADVLITGETGVGKTALARAMHGWSRRSGGPFVTVHLGDLTPTLIESELFGHERGAFTGASDQSIGRFERARGGTIFLDEVGETPLAIQSKLLRAVQERCFERVGGGRTVNADLRIIAATSRDLRSAMRRGEFREDLFYRLNVVPLDVPPLRARGDDLELLVDAILARMDTGERGPRRLAPDACRRLREYAWPGNVRELESVLRRSSILEEGDELALEGFPDRAPAGAAAAAVEPDGWPTLEEHERRYVRRVLELKGGVIEGASGAAQLLGLHPSTLRSLMKRLGLSAHLMRARGRR